MLNDSQQPGHRRNVSAKSRVAVAGRRIQQLRTKKESVLRTSRLVDWIYTLENSTGSSLSLPQACVCLILTIILAFNPFVRSSGSASWRSVLSDGCYFSRKCKSKLWNSQGLVIANDAVSFWRPWRFSWFVCTINPRISDADSQVQHCDRLFKVCWSRVLIQAMFNSHAARSRW